MSFGHLVVFRKGKSSAPYELDEGEHSIGSSTNSNIRLKFSHPLLLETHALILVNKNGMSTLVNKSVEAPVRINGKRAVKPTFLRHEDKFEILDKIFQYFNENLKDEPEDSEKFVRDRRNIFPKSRQSVNPLIKTPAKKSPNLKTKVPSVRKSDSAGSRSSKSLQVIITPNKKPHSHAGSKTTSKIIVSKALVSPRSAKKRRLSLDSADKKSRNPKISVRNILLSKSTINITISEEHEYSEVTPMKTIQEGNENAKSRTLSRSVKVENTVTPNKDISVALIDINTPTVNSPKMSRPSSARRVSLQHQSVFETENSTENPTNVMKTPVNKRIQSLKMIRHSLKKDTPPPRLILPKVLVQPPTPQCKSIMDVSLTGNCDDISISYSPNAEPSNHSFTQKANKSRVSFAIEAPTGASPISLESLNESYHSTHEDVPSEKNNFPTTRESRGKRNISNDELTTPDVQRTAKRSTKSTQGFATEDEKVLEVSKYRKSSRYSLNTTKKLAEPLRDSSSEEMDELQLDELDKSTYPKETFANTSKNVSIRSAKLDKSASISGNRDDAVNNSEKPTRLSRNGSRISNNLYKSGLDISERSTKFEEPTTPSRNEPAPANVNISRISRHSSMGRTSIVLANASQREDNAADHDNINKSRLSRNISRRSTTLETSPDFSQTKNITPDSKVNVDRSSRNASSSSINDEGSVDSSQAEDIPTDEEDKIDRSFRLSRNASRRSTKIEESADSSQTEDIATDDDINRSSRLSRNTSRRSTKNKESADSSQTEDSSNEENLNKSSRVSRNISKRSSRLRVPSCSQTEDVTISDTTEGNVNRSFNISGNTSKRSSRIDVPASLSQLENKNDDINKSSRVSRNIFTRSIKVRTSINSSQTDGSTTEQNSNKSSRTSISSSRKSQIIDESDDFSHSENDTTDEESNVKKSRLSRKIFYQSTKIEEPVESSQTEDNTTDAEENINKSSRMSRNISRRSKNLEQLSSSLLTEVNSVDAEESFSKSTRSSKNVSQNSTVPAVKEVPAKTPDRSVGNWSRRRTRALGSQSSIDSAETTMNVQQKSEDANISNNAKNKSRQRFSVFDESTQEAKPKENVSQNRSRQRISIFDESTKETLPEFDKSKSVKPISILDSTQEVLSPVQPLSPRKSIRNIQDQDLEGSISPSTRISTIRKSRTKSQILQDSSLTTTSMDQSSSSVISISSQSFSSFKRGSSRREDSQNETEIDVVNISSQMDVSEGKKSFRAGGGDVKSEILEESNSFRSSKRQSRTSEHMFKDVFCTSTPFHKQNLSKNSRESDTSGSKNSIKDRRSNSSAASGSKRVDVISISSLNDSVFSHSSAEKKSSSILNRTETSRRSSSRRSSVSKHGGEHNCVSCRNSSVKRSRSLSGTVEPLVVEKNVSILSTRSKTPRKSSGDVLQQSYEETSPVKRISSSATSKMTTPLIHRKSLAMSLNEKTPEKAADIEDETPKSSIKPARRSSKANQSAYNPVLEDITPVTPEKLAVSGITEDVFKTPINTPGLFENIRKSVIRSRKRHRESTGSTMKESKRARVDFAQEEQLETSFEAQYYAQQKPQKSPKNDLTNIDGLKELFSTPKDQARSPKKIPDLRRLVSPRRQTTPRKGSPQIPNLKSIMSPKQRNSPKKDLRSPVGDKQLLETSKTKKDNDLRNVTGVSNVSNVLNVSGVEVLHQGSDIENSEDLFTKLTGKRPVRAYPRGKSLSPNKNEQEQTQSRKTMGDIPICSPRVQQWVEDHANVMYASIENVPKILVGEDEDLLSNVSGRSKRRSKTGRSVSPNKSVPEKKSRRKTQGDVLGDSPNVTAWKAKEAKTRRSSAARTIKMEIFSPNPIQTLFTTEKVTPQQLKSKTEMLTPQFPIGDGATPASIKAGRGRSKKLADEQQRGTPQEQKLTAEHTAQKQVTPVGESVTPGSVKAKIGRLNSKSIDQPKETPHQKNLKSEMLTPKDLLGNGATPASIKTGSGSSKKLADEQQRGTPQKQKLTAEHTAQKQVTLGESVTNVTAGTELPRNKTVVQHTESPQQQTLTDKNTSVDSAVTPTSVKAKRGRAKKVAVDMAKETRKDVSTDEPPVNVLQIPKEKENKPLETVKRGRRVKRIISTEQLDVVSSTTRNHVEPITKRSRIRRGAAKMEEEDDTPEVSTNTRSRKGKVESQIELPSDDIESEAAPRSRSRRNRKQSESEPIEELEAKKPTRGRPRRNKENDTEVTSDKSVSPVRKSGREEKKAEKATASMESELSKSTRGKQIDDKRAHKEDVNEQKEATPKAAVRGRGLKKNDVEQPFTKKVESSAEKKVISKGKRGQKIDEENQTDLVTQSHVDTTKPATGRRGKKAKVVENTEGNETSDEIIKAEVKTFRGKRGKKLESLEEAGNNDEPIVAKTTKNRRGKKDEGKNAEETESHPKVKEVKPKGRGQKIVPQDDATEEGSDPDVEFKRPLRDRAKKGEPSSAKIVAENVASPAKKTTRSGVIRKKEQSDLTPSSPEAKVRGRRGAKVVEHVIEVEERKVMENKETVKRGRGRKVAVEESENAQEIEVNAKVELSKKSAKGKGKKGKVAVELEKPTKNDKGEETPEVPKSPKKPSTRGRGMKLKEVTTDEPSSQSSQKRNARNPRNKIIEEVIEMDVDSPRTARAKRGVNKKYSTDEYEVAEKKSGTKRNVHFEDDLDADTKTPEVSTRKSKRTRI